MNDAGHVEALPRDLTVRRLLIEIARCPIMEAHLNGLNRGLNSGAGCRDVVLHQWKAVRDRNDRVKRWPREHHLPEPWIGHLESAPILFLASNPNIKQLRDAEPDKGWIPNREPVDELGAAKQLEHPSLNRPFAAAKWYWGNSELVDAFDAKFDVWVTETGTNEQPLKPGQKGTYVPQWGFARDQAAQLVDDPKAGHTYALTEVVHCKSPHEKGVELALEPCVTRYLEAVLGKSPARAIFVLGLYAARGIELLNPALRSRDLAADIKNCRPGKVIKALLAGHDRFLIYMPHPGWLIKQQAGTREPYVLPKVASGDVSLEQLQRAVRA